MESLENDPLTLKAAADSAVEQAAARLRRLLHEAATRLRPFPSFPGAFFTNAVEIEPAGGAAAGLGCVVVCEDGGLYELRMGVDLESLSLGLSDPVSLRNEELHPLELHPADYIPYAYSGLTALVERLAERGDVE